MDVLTQEERNVAENLRAMRKAKGWTLEETEQRSGVKLPTISAVELGNCSPRLGIVAKLAKAFNVTVDSLMTAPKASRKKVPA